MNCIHNSQNCEISVEPKKIEVPINLDIIDFYPINESHGYYIERRKSRFVIVYGYREIKDIQQGDFKEKYEVFHKISDARDGGRLHVYDSAGMAAYVIKREILPLYPKAS